MAPCNPTPEGEQQIGVDEEVEIRVPGSGQPSIVEYDIGVRRLAPGTPERVHFELSVCISAVPRTDGGGLSNPTLCSLGWVVRSQLRSDMGLHVCSNEVDCKVMSPDFLELGSMYRIRIAFECPWGKPRAYFRVYCNGRMLSERAEPFEGRARYPEAPLPPFSVFTGAGVDEACIAIRSHGVQGAIRNLSVTDVASPTAIAPEPTPPSLPGPGGRTADRSPCDSCSAIPREDAVFCDQCGKRLAQCRSRSPRRRLGGSDHWERDCRDRSDTVFDGSRLEDRLLRFSDDDWFGLRAMVASTAMADGIMVKEEPVDGPAPPGWKKSWEYGSMANLLPGGCQWWREGEGPVLEVNLEKVWALQRSIKSRFRDGRKVLDLVEGLLEKRVNPMKAKFLVLTGAVAYVRGGGERIYTFDHRRAYALVQAGVKTCRFRIVLSGRAFDEFASKADCMGRRITEMRLRR